MDDHHLLHPVVASCDRAADLAAFQAEHVEGPLVDAFLGGDVVVDRDVPTSTRTWPRFAGIAGAVGYRTVHAVPLVADGDVVGALVIGDLRARALGRDELAVVRALADEAAVAVVGELASHHWEEVAHQLQHALDSRVLVEQAKGALAERLGTTQNVAFEQLRSYARSHNRRIDDVARAVLAGSVGVAS